MNILRMGRDASRRSRAVTLAMLLGTTVALSGCGVTYISPAVRASDEEAPVTVLPLTADSVAFANSSPYTPRSLPAAFYLVAGNQYGVTGPGGFPSTPYVPDEEYRQLEYRPLPDASPRPYRIGVGDVILLATRGAANTVEQLSGLLAAQTARQGYTVRDDGTIAILDFGNVSIAGLTLQEAEDAIFELLAQAQVDPSFSLEVAEFNSQKVAVGGAVRQDALVPITLNELSLRSALTAAGGVDIPGGSFGAIRIYRNGTLYQIPIDRYRDDPSIGDKLLFGGDAVFVDLTYDLQQALEFFETKIDVIALRSSSRKTALDALSAEIAIQRSALQEQRSIFESRVDLDAEQRDYVYLTGEVSRQGRVPLPYERQASLADVLYEQGGFDTTTGNPAQIYVLRDGPKTHEDGKVLAYHLDARNAARIVAATSFQMRPNDIVFIEEQPITKWGRALQQLFPTLLNAASRAATVN